MTELGVGYLSIVASTDGMQKQIDQSLSVAQGSADKAGVGMGGRMAGGLSKALKFGVAGVGLAAGATIGTALTQGMGRLVAIDDARGKLQGLGHDTAAVQTIMDSALASVKGTAFGLGDAATIAASAVAAGIEPGQQLQSYLSLTADTATIAGTSLEEMGSIFNKVQTSGTVFTDNLNQLSDRGIPIFQWLQDEYKVSAEELSDMVSSGEVDAETFKRVIEQNIGGAALESGKTLRGSFENMKAALGRAGAEVIEPFLPMLQTGLAKVTSYADKVAPYLEAGATKVAGGLSTMGRAFASSGDSIEGQGSKLERFGAKARQVADGVSGIWSILANGDFKGADMTFGLEEDSKAVDILFKIRETAVGVYDILFRGDYTNPIWGGLEDSKAVDVLFRIREGALGLWESIRGTDGEKFASTLETIGGSGATAAGVLENVSGVATNVAGAATMMGSATAEAGTSLLSLGGDTATVAAAGIGAVASAMGFLADHTALVGPLLIGVVASMGTAKAVETGYQTAMIARTVLMPAQIAAQVMLTRSMDRHTAALTVNSVSQRAQMISTQGATATSLVYRTALDQQTAATARATGASAAAAGAGGMGAMRTAAGGLTTFLMGPFGAALAVGGIVLTGLLMLKGAHNDAAKAAEEQQQKEEALGRTLDENSGKVTDATRKDIAKEAQETGDLDRASSYGLAPTDVVDATTGTGDPRAAERIQALGQQNVAQGLDSSASFGRNAANYAEAGITREELQGALLREGDGWEQVSQKIERYNQVQQLSESGVRLNGLQGLIDTFDDTNESAVTLTQNVNKNRIALDAGAEALRNTNSALNGSLELTAAGAQKFAELGAAVESIPTEHEVIVRSLTDEARKQLLDTGYAVDGLPDGTVKITAQTDEAKAEMERLTAELEVIDGRVVSPKIYADSTVFRIEDQAVRDSLAGIDRTLVSPEIGAVLDGFIAGRDITFAELSKLDLSTAEPDVQLLIQQALEQARVVNEAIDKAARERTVPIRFAGPTGLITDPGPSAAPLPNSLPLGLATRDSGGRLPTSGPGTNMRDGFLGVDAAGMPIARVGRGEWVVNENSSNKYDREIRDINAGTFPKLPGYDEGGRIGVTNDDLLALANGSQGQPLTGAPYVWGGVNWGDCSAAMSAFARFAVGLPAFAGRFATATMGAALTGMGFSLGQGGPGDLRFGWYNGGPGGGHTAGTLPDDTNIEMGGSNGGGMLGGSVGANSAQFTDHAFLTIGPSATFDDPGGWSQQGRGRVNADGSPMTGTDVDTSAMRAGSTSTGSSSAAAAPTSISQAVGDAAGSVVSAFISGQISDALGYFGAPDSLPPIVQAGQSLQEAWAQRGTAEPSADERAAGAQVGPPADRSPSVLDNLGDAPQTNGVGELARDGDFTGALRQTFGVEEDNPLVGAVLDARSKLLAFRQFATARGFLNGGKVTGPPGVDNIPAWLTAEEVVVNAAGAQAGANPALLAAMNAGAKFTVGQTESAPAPVRQGNTYHLYGITDADDAMRRVRTNEKMANASIVGTESL